MKKMLLALGVLMALLLGGCQQPSVSGMNQQQLEEIIKSLSKESKGDDGYVAFIYQGVEMHLISDVVHNRMRIVSPIVQYEKLSTEQIDAIMEANFHSSLDGRYAVSDGLLYAAFIHPLEELSEWEIESGVYQVANLVRTFGTSYSSGGLEFGGGRSKPGDKSLASQFDDGESSI